MNTGASIRKTCLNLRHVLRSKSKESYLYFQFGIFFVKNMIKFNLCKKLEK